MRGRKPEQFALRPKDKTFLREPLRDGQTPLKVARRAQILLSRADDQQRLVLLGEKVEQNASTLWRGCDRDRPVGLQAAFYHAPPPGRPPIFFPERAQAALKRG